MNLEENIKICEQTILIINYLSFLIDIEEKSSLEQEIPEIKVEFDIQVLKESKDFSVSLRQDMLNLLNIHTMIIQLIRESIFLLNQNNELVVKLFKLSFDFLKKFTTKSQKNQLFNNIFI